MCRFASSLNQSLLKRPLKGPCRSLQWRQHLCSGHCRPRQRAQNPYKTNPQRKSYWLRAKSEPQDGEHKIISTESCSFGTLSIKTYEICSKCKIRRSRTRDCVSNVVNNLGLKTGFITVVTLGSGGGKETRGWCSIFGAGHCEKIWPRINTHWHAQTKGKCNLWYPITWAENQLNSNNITARGEQQGGDKTKRSINSKCSLPCAERSASRIYAPRHKSGRLLHEMIWAAPEPCEDRHALAC